jgi:DNA-binding IclR family transcriptional regulator
MTDHRARPKGAVEKAFALLAELQSAGEAVRLSELCRRLDLPKSTAHRTLKILVESGLVAQSGVRYQAVFSRRVAGRAESHHADVFHRLTPFVCDVLMRTGMTASLAVLDRAEVTFPYRAYAHDRVRTDSDVTGRGCAYGTAAGRLLMAFDADALRGVVVACGLDSDQVAELNRDLFAVRRRCFTVRRSAGGFTCVAVPLLGAKGLPRVALTVRGETSSVDVDRVVYSMRRVAQAAASTVFSSMLVAPRTLPLPRGTAALQESIA